MVTGQHGFANLTSRTTFKSDCIPIPLLSLSNLASLLGRSQCLEPPSQISSSHPIITLIRTVSSRTPDSVAMPSYY